MDLFIDIETIPDQREGAKEEIAATLTPPGNMKKEETIAKWEAEEKPALVEEAWRKTALDGARGEIVCIGMALDDGGPVVLSRDVSESETGLLKDFYRWLSQSLRDEHGQRRKPVWIGHYITGFDLRFIWQRSVIQQVLPSLPIPYNAKPWASEVFDTKFEWTGLNAGYTGSGKLDAVCQAMGLPGKDGFDGSMVWDAVLAGEIDKVASYCGEDVRKVQAIYKRMMFY